MTKKIKLTTPLTDEVTLSLKAGDLVSITGTIYTARDAAHLKMMHTIENDEALPFDISGQIIYYVGPSPAKPGEVIGSAGPTTSYRMDDLTVPLLERGLKGMIGKGNRNSVVIAGIQRHNAVYFGAVGGAGALIAGKVVKSEVICYEMLGTEAVRKLQVVDFPAIVIIDTLGKNLYEIAREKYGKHD